MLKRTTCPGTDPALPQHSPTPPLNKSHPPALTQLVRHDDVDPLNQDCIKIQTPRHTHTVTHTRARTEHRRAVQNRANVSRGSARAPLRPARAFVQI